MIRFVLRFVGLLLLALGFIFLVYDGIRTISGSTWLITKTSYVWNIVNDASFQSFQQMIERRLGPDVWQYGVGPVLEQPASAVAAVLGIILILLGRKKRRLIGYARD
jgi:hypothetical protein